MFARYTTVRLSVASMRSWSDDQQEGDVFGHGTSDSFIVLEKAKPTGAKGTHVAGSSPASVGVVLN